MSPGPTATGAVSILHHTVVGGQRPGSQGVAGIFEALRARKVIA